MDRRPEFRLLVVEPQSVFRSALEEGLELCRHQVFFDCRFADDESGAARLLGSFAPSVVLVDLHLLGTQGVNLIRHCAEAHVPVVVTAEARTEDARASATSHGASAVVQKTEDPEEIESVVELLARVAVQTASPQ